VTPAASAASLASSTEVTGGGEPPLDAPSAPQDATRSPPAAPLVRDRPTAGAELGANRPGQATTPPVSDFAAEESAAPRLAREAERAANVEPDSHPGPESLQPQKDAAGSQKRPAGAPTDGAAPPPVPSPTVAVAGADAKKQPSRSLKLAVAIGAALAIGVAGSYLIFSSRGGSGDSNPDRTADLAAPADERRPESARSPTAVMRGPSSTRAVALSASMARDQASGCYVWKPNLKPDEEVRWVGGCVNSLATGPGKAEWFVDGSVVLTYEGAFSDGMLQGPGRMVASGGDVYEGDYLDGQRHGRGSYIAASGERYDGQWQGNQRHGAGALTYASGDRYEGEFRENKREGTGTYTKPDGERYVGEYRNDRREGQGTLLRADGARYDGLFREGRPVGEIVAPLPPTQTASPLRAPPKVSSETTPERPTKSPSTAARPQTTQGAPQAGTRVAAERPAAAGNGAREADDTAAPAPARAGPLSSSRCSGLAGLRLEQCRSCREQSRLRQTFCEEKVRFTYCIGKGAGSSDCPQPTETREP
jgi:hypothetical protein